MATHPLNLRNRAEVGKTRCAQTVPHLFSARLRKFKESFAISGAHFFAYFLWARPKKVSQPRQGMKQGMHQQPKTLKTPSKASAVVPS
ncbi:hypothetical protein [Ralstonia wenshanensis]|nr:hypothetical protein [Ralstonia wenshanensis]